MATEIAGVCGRHDGGISVVTAPAEPLIFLGDLIRRLPTKLRFGLMAVSAYAERVTAPSGAPLEQASLPDLRNCSVLIVDNIVETGRTLRVVQVEFRGLEQTTISCSVTPCG